MALHGFSKHGTGGGAGPVSYFIAGEYYHEGYDENGDRIAEWRMRDPLPEVIEGDAALMIAMIDAVPTKHKYTSGVLSFTAGDTLKLKAVGFDEAVQDIISKLKDMLFAGISEEYQQILIVQQTHLGRLELHYVTPRWNYEVDRAFNIAPPGKAKFEAMDALTDLINVKYGLDDPRDPLRARVTKDPQWAPTDKPTRDMLNTFFTDLVIDGIVNNREELIKFAQHAEFKITRTGTDYISLKAPGSEKAIRLRGEIYNEQFTNCAQLVDTKTKIAERAAYLAKPAIIERYKNSVGARSAFVEKRFAKILKSVRDGKAYEEAHSVYATVRDKGTEIRTDNFGCMRTDVNNNRSYKGFVNDGPRKEIDSLIATAERTIGNTKHGTSTASTCFRDSNNVIKQGTSTLKSTGPIINTVISKALYSSIPSAPIHALGFGADSSDSGDPEADRILRIKRIEGNEINQKHVARANREAAASRKSFDLER